MLSRYHVAATLRHIAVLQPRILYRNRFHSTNVRSETSQLMKLHDATPRTIQDFLTPSRVDLLNLTLSPYLPGIISPEAHSEPESLPPGYHFIFFPTSTSELDMLEDGYEKHFAPLRPFKRRVWTQGSLHFDGYKERNGLLIGEWAECMETVHKVVEKENATDVWIQRLMKSNESSSTVTEYRCLRYLHDFPPESRFTTFSASEIVSPGSNEILTHSFTPSRILLTRFSYLTYNFHRIHIDKEYARTIERYPDVLIHGSLSIILILTILRQFFESENKKFKIASAKYIMLRPLYVDNPVTLTFTNSRSDSIRAILWDNYNQKAVECVIKSHIS